MKNKNILFFTGFVGGRGSSKAVRWAYDGFKERGFNPIIVSESVYLYKLKDLNLKPDYVIQRKPEETDKSIYLKTAQVLSNINFNYMLAFNPRTYGSYYAYKKGIPYTIVEYSAPVLFEKYPSKRIGKVYENANLYLCLCPFQYQTPIPQNLKNVKVCTQPYPSSRIKLAKKIRKLSKQQAKEKIYQFYPELRKNNYDQFIILNINDEYINPYNIFPNNQNFQDKYGDGQNGYLRLNDFDQTIGFVNRLISGLETNYPGKTLIYMLEKVKEFAQPTLNYCQKVKAFSRPSPFIDLNIDLLLKQSTDINICRTALSDNQCDLYLLGKTPVTSIVPLNFMNEDKAMLEAKKKNTAYLIPYNDSKYIQKLTKFTENKKLQNKISKQMFNNFKAMWKNNNFYDYLMKDIAKI